MIRGSLFTRFFLEDGIRASLAYRALSPEALDRFAATARRLWRPLAGLARPTEDETEKEFILPLLTALGWSFLTQQEPGHGRRDIADALLFTGEAAKEAAFAERDPADRFRHGAVVVESEARDTRLDRAGGGREAPSTQMLRYLGRAEAQSGGAVRWGLLANGRFWRLYWAQARARAEGFVELDLPALLGEGGDLADAMPVPEGAPEDHWRRVFLLLFRAAALSERDASGHHFLDIALTEGRLYEQRLTATLSAVVFDEVFPTLVAAIAAEAPDAPLPAVRDSALRLLFRLLFLLYAEDRDLLPVRAPAYAGYGLRGLREQAARIADERTKLSPRARTWWPRLAALFAAIGAGDPALDLPPYNGGLFDAVPDDVLAERGLGDAALAPLIDAMSRIPEAGARRWINYRDLSVQHLGGIYERLLERDPVREADGRVRLFPNPYARKTSGSYYTPDELVLLVLRRALGPLLAEARERFAARAAALSGDRRAVAARLADLAALDPAEAFVALRVCDPAMGSGHFLVALVDFLTDRVLEALGDAPASVPWAGAGPYVSPLAGRIAALRARLRAEATAGGWPVAEDQLDDRHLVRRIVLKRVAYGVDLNPMAVELAKLSLWLHSFTIGAPLSFLDHHLRVGDSLFGEFVFPVEDDLRARFGLAMSQAVVRARLSAKGMAEVEALADADLAEVRRSKEVFATVEEGTAELRGLLDLYHAARWLPADADGQRVRAALFGGFYGDPAAIGASGDGLRAPREDRLMHPGRNGGGARQGIDPAADFARARAFVNAARALARARRFVHWEAAFPGVWEEWERAEPTGGFDAVIGNPPWDRMKMQEVEWFAARVPAVAMAQRAADRKRAIIALREAGDSVARAYDDAAGMAERAVSVAAGTGPFPPARGGGTRAAGSRDYPLLSGGDTNLYALFVERAARLARADGVVGLVVPSGIAADKGAAEFFRGISTTGRLGSLLDFENRRNALGLEPFFPDVDSRFKFSVLVFGGAKRQFARAECAFFQQDAEAAEAASFPLTPEDFLAVNPNTGTAPVFRTPRDAEITRGIYRRVPVLVDRRAEPPRAVWPLRYLRMFDMTNDSEKFRTAAELEAMGAYRVKGGAWEKGRARWVALYEGKMVQAFDHRAASVVVNPANLHRPGQPEPASLGQHRNPDWRPEPQFWVAEREVQLSSDLKTVLAFKEITSSTNARTIIAAIVPRVGFGNKLPLLLPSRGAKPGGARSIGYGSWSSLLCGNLNSCALDFVARQKVHATTLNLFILEQLPIIPPDAYARRFGRRSAADIVREDVLRLTYTAHDMAAFARDQGHDGPPFAWDEEDRLRRRARLDAVFFHLYGLDRADADYILSTFPIVRREEESRHAGRFRSRDLILGTMAALAAGAPDAAVEG